MLSSPPQPLFLALDGGGTKTRAVISTKTADGGAKVVAQAISGGSNVSEAGMVVCVRELKRATERAIAALPAQLLPPAASAPSASTLSVTDTCTLHFQSVWVGLAGADNPPIIATLSVPLTQYFKTPPLIQNDALLLSSPLIRLGAKTGVMVIAGTGSVCVSVQQSETTGEMETVSRRGGLGFLLGDEGSAFSFGRTALRAVLYAYDQQTLDVDAPFTKAFLAYWGADDISALLAQAYWFPEGLVGNEGENYRKLKVAESARIILAHACPSPTATFPADPLALSVVRDCARDLALDISRLLLPSPRGLDPSTSMLTFGGSLVGQPTYQAILLATLKDEFGVVFGYGHEHVGDAAGDAARVLALKG